MVKAGEPYYRADLALVHHLGFGFHADDCAPGILELLGPVRERHVNVPIDTARVRPLLAEHGVRATIGDSFGSGVELLSGLHTIIGHKDP